MGRHFDVLFHRYGWSDETYAFFYLILLQAKNVTNYLRVIHKILAPGGVWVNLGQRRG